MTLLPPTGKIYWDEFVEWDIKINKMKAYTDIDQSKKLAEILPIESADMYYSTWTIVSEDGEFIVSVNQQGETIEELQREYGNQIIPCWSLSALLEQLNDSIVDADGNDWQLEIYKEDGLYYLNYHDRWEWKDDIETDYYDNLVDACYEMIIKIRELNLL